MKTIKAIRRHARQTHLRISLLLILALVLTGRESGRHDGLQAQTTPGCPAYPNNPVACENLLPGDNNWDIVGAGDSTIQGFATEMSVNVGQRVDFKIDTPSDNYDIDIYRLGYYGGAGARRVVSVAPSVSLPQNQDPCLGDPASGLVDCGNWSVSASWDVPADAVSGVYVAKLTRQDAPYVGASSHIVFVVRNDAHQADVVFQTSDTTWQAYNRFGGSSLYCGDALSNAGSAYACNGRAAKVSYNRPIDTRGPENRSFLFSGEYPAIRWLEANGYNVKYWSGVDTDRRGGDLVVASKKPKIFLSVGHDEYWSGQQRTNVENARNAGVNLAFLSGNEVYWKTRWEPSIAPGNAAYRTLVSYKETLASPPDIDPSPDWTGTWRDTRVSAQARPENALIGAIWTVNCCTTAINVPYTMAPLRFWRNTRVADLTAGSTTLAPGTLGYEWGEVVDNGFTPAGIVRMSVTTATNQEKAINYGAHVELGTATHNLVLHRHNSGALVFGASTVQWTWGLDATHDGNLAPFNSADQAIQQATVNLFADMGNVQPATLQVGADASRPLVSATQTTDIFAPTSSITSPATGATVESGTRVNIIGTAADSGGGTVAGIEVSTDGGTSWKPALITGRSGGQTSWTFEWTPGAAGTANLRTRAVDDSANLEAAGGGVTVTIGTGICPCPNLWRATTTPESTGGNSDFPEGPTPLELGVKFRSDIDGYVTGIRFYKGPRNTGTHLGNLWDATTRANLATAVFTNETPSGWQQVLFAEPVPILKDKLYVASYHTNVGFYAVTPGLLATAPIDAPPLHAPPTGEVGGNGLFKGGASVFPDESFNGNYYWVDVIFATSTVDETAPVVSNIKQQAIDSSKIEMSWTTNEEANGRVDYSTDQSFAPALTQSITSSAFKTSQKVTITQLAPNTTYYFRITAADANGNVETFDAPTFTLPGPTLRDTADEDFRAGSAAGTHVTAMSNGEVILAPIVGTEFSGTTMPAGWISTPYTSGGASTIANGIVTVDGARFGTCTNDGLGNCTVENGIYGPGHSLEFAAVFTGDAFQHAGLALVFNSGQEPWAIFSTKDGGNLYVRTNTGQASEDINLGGTFLGGFHRYRIDWNADGTVSYYIDGVHKHTTALVVTSLLRPVAASDFSVFGGAILVDWLRMTPYASAGAFESRVFDAQSSVNWKSIQWATTTPAGTAVNLSVRIGESPTPDGSWTEFAAVAGPGALDLTSRYIQYRADLTSADPRVTPSLDDIILTTEAAPVATNDTFNVAQNSSRLFAISGPGSLTFNDVDEDTPNDDLRVVAVTAPANGGIILNADGSVRYTPAPGYNGADAFNYTVSDGLLTSSASVAINVTAVNQKPEAFADFYQANEDTLLSISAQAGLLANDFDAEGDALRAVLVTLPQSGTLSLSPTGSFTYLPAENVSGGVSFSYKANDGALDSDVVTVSIVINAVNDPPQTPKPDAYYAELNQVLTVAARGVLDNDLDTEIEGTPFLTAQPTQSPSNGTLQLNSDGSFSYTPNGDYLGLDTFKYRTVDQQGLLSALDTTVTITIATKAVTGTVPGGGTVATGQAVTPDDPLASTVTTPVPATVAIAQGVIAGSESPSGYTFLNQQVNITITDATGTEVTATSENPLVFTFAIDLSLVPAGQDHTSFEVFRNGVLVPNCLGATSIPAANFDPCVSSREGGSRIKLTILTTHASRWNMGLSEEDTGNLKVVAHNDGVYTTRYNAPLLKVAPGVLRNDFGPGTLTASYVDGSANGGTVELDASGAFVFTPALDFCGPANFQYRAQSGELPSSVATVTLKINCLPVAGNDTAAVAEDSGANAITVLANDSDPDQGQTVRVTEVTQAANGTVAIGPNGMWVTYEPNANFNGSDSFTYTASDNLGDSSTATVTVTVTGINDAPSFTKGADQTVLEDSAPQSVFNWATNISAGPSENGQALEFLVTNNNPSLFSVAPAIDSNGTLTYYAAPNAYGVAIVTVRLRDNGGAAEGGADTSAAQTFTITVTGVNDAPTFVKGANESLSEDYGSRTVAAWATAIDAGSNEADQTLTFVVTNDNNSLFSVQPAIAANGTLTYDPAPNANGTATVTVTLRDNGGTANGGVDASAPQTFTITLYLVNDAPSFTKGANQSVNEDAGAATVPAWATNISAGPGDEAGQAVNFIVTAENAALFAVQPAVAADGTLTYTPAADAYGSTNVSVQLHDDGGAANGGADTSAAQVFSITVNAVNDAPSFTKGADQTVGEDAGAQSIAGWASNVSAGPMESGQTVEFVVTTDNAALFAVAPAIDAAGALTFQSAPNAYGVATVTVQLRDNGGVENGGVDTSAAQTFTITVTSVNDAPDAVDDTTTVVEDSSANAINVLGNDSFAPDVNETLTVTAVTQGANGSVSFTATGVSYTPNPNFFGSDSFTYTISDGNGGSDTATVSVTVTNVNDAPDAVNDNVTVAEDSSATAISVLANDSFAPDAGETLTVTAVTQGANGSVTFTGTGVSYTPNANFFGGDSFTYTISDGNGGNDTATVYVTVTNVNDAPDAVNDTATIAEDSGANAIDVRANDSIAPDTGETLTVTAVTQGSNGSVTFTGTGVSYTPNANFFGADSFTYTISDGNGGSDTATVNVTVTNVNDAPDAVNDSATVVEDSGANAISVLANDSFAPDAGETLTVTAVTQGANGSVTFTGTGVSYTPNANFFGSDSFTYTISDGNGGSDTATVNVTVTNVNDAPDAVDDTATVAEDSGATAISVLANDSFAPDAGETLTVTAVTQPANGSVTFTATGVSFTPSANFFGSTSFTYTISDDNGGSDTATVNVTVTSVNDAPDAVNDSQTVAEDSGATSIGVLANDSIAPDTGETLTVTAVTQPANGSATFTATSVSFTPNANFFGTTSFAYTISDGNGGSDTATVNVTVTAVNDAPDAVNDTATVAEDSGASAISVLANDTFAPDTGETLSVTAVTQPAHGSATFTATGVSYTPAANYNGPDSFTYTIGDGNGANDTATVDVTVTSVNDAPDAVNDTKTVAEDSGATAISVLVNDSIAPDTGETLTVTAVTQPAHGSATFTATGVSYTPAADYNGSDSFTYTISDGNGGNDTATVSMTVTAVNDNPTVANDATELMQNSSATTIDVLANDSSVPDGPETLTINSVTQPANGTVAITSAGTRVTYTPATGFNGTNTFTYTIGDGNGGSATATVTVTVRPTPSLRIENTSLAEGNSGFTTFGYPVNLSGPSLQTVTVSYQTFNGSARDGRDYVSETGTITFQPGEVSKTADISVIGETTKEKDETFAVRLSNPVGATIARVEAVGIILDDDSTPTAQVSSAKQSEGNGEFTGDGGALNELSFKVTLSNLSEIPVSVSYMTQGLGAAKAGVDFDALSGVLTFGEDDLVKYITIPIMGDRQHEALEKVRLKLHSPIEMILNVTEVDGDIEDDDPAPSVSVSDVTLVEGQNGTTNAVFKITLSEASGIVETLSYTTANGTATAGSDYTAVSGTITFDEGVTEMTVVVPINGDGVIEPGETFTLTVANANGSDLILGKRTGTATIVNDDSLTWTNGTYADLTAGTVGTGTVVSDAVDGSVLLTPRYITDFNGTTLPNGWVKDAQGTVTFGAGVMTVSGATVRNNGGLGVGFAVEFGATFTDVSQWGGLTSMRVNTKLDSAGVPRLWVTTITGKSSSIDTLVPGSWIGAPHRFRIEWLPTAIIYSIDGAVVATHTFAFAGNASMQVTAFDLAGGGSFIVDWARVTPFALTGDYTSTVFDAGSSVAWQTASWAGKAPLGTTVVLQMRTAESPTEFSAKAFEPVVAGAPLLNKTGRYVQYKLVLTTTSNLVSPEISEVALTYLTQ